MLAARPTKVCLCRGSTPCEQKFYTSRFFTHNQDIRDDNVYVVSDNDGSRTLKLGPPYYIRTLAGGMELQLLYLFCLFISDGVWSLQR